jgi:hypothetical protein
MEYLFYEAMGIRLVAMTTATTFAFAMVVTAAASFAIAVMMSATTTFATATFATAATTFATEHIEVTLDFDINSLA